MRLDQQERKSLPRLTGLPPEPHADREPVCDPPSPWKWVFTEPQPPLEPNSGQRSPVCCRPVELQPCRVIPAHRQQKDVPPRPQEELSLRYHEAPIRTCQSRRRGELLPNSKCPDSPCDPVSQASSGIDRVVCNVVLRGGGTSNQVALWLINWLVRPAVPWVITIGRRRRWKTPRVRNWPLAVSAIRSRGDRGCIDLTQLAVPLTRIGRAETVGIEEFSWSFVAETFSRSVLQHPDALNILGHLWRSRLWSAGSWGYRTRCHGPDCRGGPHAPFAPCGCVPGLTHSGPGSEGSW
jgi:hypothetical protein